MAVTRVLKPVTPAGVATGTELPAAADIKGDSFLKALAAARIDVSKHARPRVKGADLSETDAARLSSALDRAQEKGMKHPAVFIDKNTFMMSVPQRRIITVVKEEREQEGTYTNIDGAIKA